ncbi:MAG TPA: DegQ family serine endoprotease [Woeseiaceae bacterium]|nr:DegQ family serine endoprotease [Woeseiaceae bacterium]
MNPVNATLRKGKYLILICALGACSEGSNAQLDQEERQESRANTPDPATVDARALPDFRPLVREYGDAVVNVEVLQRRERRDIRGTPEDPMYEFFRRFGIPPPGLGQRGEPPPARGAGSGFIVSEDGYILTNAHVVSGADRVTVRLTDRREFQAEVIGVDPRTDVAVIKIDATDLPTVRIGDPEALEPGQWVLAIGSPFGLENSVTAGIISATSRAVGPGSNVPFIQTDVAVNPGNSGGPLFNLQGEVVGINSMIFSQTGGYMGLSFAIPIDVATNVQQQLVETGRVVRGRIGVIVQDVNAQLAQSFGLDRPRGALVSGVEEGAPAAEAGLRPGDVILSLNDEPIERFTELGAAIAGMQPGTVATVGVWRDREEREIDVRVEEMEDASAGITADAPDGQAEEQLGLVVRPLTAEEKRMTGSEGNIVIEQVRGAAAAAGLQPGDIIMGVNSERIESIRQLREAVEESPGNVALLVQRDQATIFVPVPTD